MTTQVWFLVKGGAVSELSVRQGLSSCDWRAGNGGEAYVGRGEYPEDAVADFVRGEALLGVDVIPPHASAKSVIRRVLDAAAIDAAREIAKAVAAERARCVAVCREVAAQHWATGKGGAAECAEAIERGAVGL